MDELQVDNAYLEFGDLDFSPEIHHVSPPICVRNVAEFPVTLNSSVQYPNTMEEFPVRLCTQNFDSSDIAIPPGECASLSFVLQPDSVYMSDHNLGTSFFKVSRRFFLSYKCPDGVQKSLSMSFAANLCISVMYLENPSVTIENKMAGDEFSHDIMIWNRSESNLHFQIQDAQVIKSGEVEPMVSLSSNGMVVDTAMSDAVIVVPSFAPKIITIRMVSQTPGKFTLKYKFVNVRNTSNVSFFELQGSIVDPKDMKRWQLMDDENSNIIEVQNGVRKLYLGDFFFGQRTVRKVSVVNMGSTELRLELSRNSSSNKEIRFYFLDEKDGEIYLEDEESRQSNVVVPPPKAKESQPLVAQVRNPYAAIWNESWQSENQRGWDSFDSSYTSASNANLSISKLCMRLFSYEYVERGDEEDLNFGLMRPMHTQRNSSQSHAQTGLIRRHVAKMLTIPSGGKMTLVAEVCPSQEHHENLSHEYAQVMKRVTEVRVNSSYGETVPDESAVSTTTAKETISFEYRACMCKIGVSPPSQSLGECHLGESYKVPITVTNLSELPVTLRPVIASSGCEISLSDVKLAPLEKKNITIRLVPTIVTPNFIATVKFRSVVGMVEGELEVTGKATSALPLRFHSLFYQLSGSLVRNNHQLHFGRVICNMSNFAKVRVKNTSRIGMKLSFWNHTSTRLRMTSATVESDAMPALEKVASFDQEAAELMRSDIEELKWGLSFNENHQFSATKGPGLKGESKLSSNVEALDVTPLQSKRSSEFSRRHGSLGHERALMERYSELHHLASFQDLGSELIREREQRDKEAAALTANKASTRGDNSTREMIDTMKKLVFPWLFRELDTDKLITDIEGAEVTAFSQFSNQDCVKPFLTQSTDGNDDQEKARAAQDLQQRLETWFSKSYVPVFRGDEADSSLLPPDYTPAIDVRLYPGEERDLIFELHPVFNEESDIDGKLFTSSIIAKIDPVDPNALSQVLTEALQEDAELERTIQTDPTAIRRLSLYSIPIHYQSFCAEFAVIPRTLNFGRTVVGESVVRYLRIVNKSPLYCPYVIEKSGSIASGFLTVTGGRKGIVPPLSSVNLEVRFKPTMPFILEEDLKIRNVINALNDQIVPMKSKVLRTDTFAIALQDEAATITTTSPTNPDDATKVGEGLQLGEGSLLSMQNMIDQEYRDTFNALLAFISGGARATSSIPLTSSSALSAMGGGGGGSVSTVNGGGPSSSSGAAATMSSSGGSKDHASQTSLYKYMGSSAVGKNPSIVVKFILRNMTSKTRQFVVDSTSNDAVELLDLSQLSLHDVGEEKSAEVMTSLRTLIGHPHNFAPIPEVLQNVLCMRCHFSSRLEKQQKLNLQAVEDDESLQALLDQLEKMQQKLKIALRKNKAEKIVKYRKKVEDCIQQLASKASSKSSIDQGGSSKGSKKKTGTTASEKATTHMITEDTELAHFVELAPEEEVHIEMRLSYLPSAQYRLWKGLLPFIGRVRVFELRHEDIKKTLYFGTMLYASTIEMSSLSETGRSRLNSFESDVNSEVSSVGFDRKLSLGHIKEMDAKSAPFLVTIPLWCSMMTKQVYPKYKKIPFNVVGGSVKLTRSRKDNSMGGTFMVTAFHEKSGQMEFLIDEKFIPIQIVTENKTIEMKQYGSMLIKVQDTPSATTSYGLDTKDLSGNASTSHHHQKATKETPFHDLSAKRFVTSLSNSQRQRSRKTFLLRWNPSQFVELPSEEFKLIGALKVTYGAIDNTYYSILLPFVCAYQHKSIIDVDKYCSLGERSIGSYSTLQFSIKNTSDEEELHYIVTAESSDVQTAKGFIEIIAGKSGVIPPGESKNVSILFTATAVGRFSQKLWVQNIRDGFDQRRIVAQANVIVSPARFVVFPDLEPADLTAKKKEIDFGLVEIQEDEMVYCDCQYDNMLADPSNGFYTLKIRNVSTTRLSVTVVSNLRKQCFIFADKEGSIPAVNVLLPKGEDSCLYIFLRPTKVVDSTTTATGGKTYTTEGTTGGGGSGASDFQREITGGLRLVFFSAESDVSSWRPEETTPTTTTPSATANATTMTTADGALIAGGTTTTTAAAAAVTEEILVHRKLFETALSFRATVGKSVVKAQFVADDIYNVRPAGHDAGELPRIPLKIRNESQSFPLRYWLCTCSRSSYSGKGVFRLVHDEEQVGFLKPVQEIVTSIGIEKDESLVGITYKHLRVHNLGANESTEVAKMLHFPSPDLAVALETHGRTLASFVSVKHPSSSTGPPSMTDDRDREALITTLPFCQPLSCTITLTNQSATPMALYPISNLPILLHLTEGAQHLQELADLATIELHSFRPRIEELVNGFSRNLRLQAITIPSYRLGKFQVCGDALALRPGQRVTFAVSSLAEYTSDWLVSNDVRRLSHSQALDLMGFLGFMCLDIAATTIDGNDVYAVVPPEQRRFMDHSYLALRGGTRFPLKILSPRINVKPRDIKLGKINDTMATLTTDIEFTNKSGSDIVCVLEASSPWCARIHGILSLEDGTVLAGDQWHILNDRKYFAYDFATSVTVKVQLSLTTKLLLADSFLNVHSYTKDVAAWLFQGEAIDLATLEPYRVATQKVKVHFESESVLPTKGFVLSVADSKSTVLAQGEKDIYPTTGLTASVLGTSGMAAATSSTVTVGASGTTGNGSGAHGSHAGAVGSGSTGNSASPMTAGGGGTPSGSSTISSEYRLSVLCSDMVYLPKVPTQDALSFKEKSGLMTRKTCKFTLKNLSRRSVHIQAQYAPLARFMSLVDTEATFSKNEQSITHLEHDETCQLKVRIGFVDNFKLTRRLLDGMKPLAMPAEMGSLAWTELLALFPPNKSDEVYLISPDKRRILLKIGQGTVHMVPTTADAWLTTQSSASSTTAATAATASTATTPPPPPSSSDAPTTAIGGSSSNSSSGDKGSTAGTHVGGNAGSLANVSYTESMDLFVIIQLEHAVIPMFEESLLSLTSPLKMGLSDVDQDEDEAIHFLFCGSLESDDPLSMDAASYEVSSYNPHSGTGGSSTNPANHSNSNSHSNGGGYYHPAPFSASSSHHEMTLPPTAASQPPPSLVGHPWLTLYRPQYCSLLEDSQTFYLHNLTTSPYKFRMKSESLRFPGLRLIFPQSSFVGCRPPMEIWTDAIRLGFEPATGEIPPESSLAIRVFFVPASPSDAKCVTVMNELAFDAANGGNTSMGVNGSTAGSTTAAGSTTDASQLSTALLYKSFTMSCEIHDREDSLHPPVHLAATLIIDRAIPLLKSQPISETNRKKQHIDLVLTDDAAVTSPVTASSTAASTTAASTAATTAASASAAAAAVASTASISGIAPPLREEHGLGSSSSGLGGNSSGFVSSGAFDSAPGAGLSSAASLVSPLGGPSSNNMLPMRRESSNGGPASSSGGGNTNNNNTTNSSTTSTSNNNTIVRLRKRGITPHATSPYHGYIDLGKQVERSDALEWAVTLENRSTEYTQYFELHALSSPPTEEWMIFNENGGIVDKQGSSTFMLYFLRSQVGRYVAYLLIRDMHQRDRDHIICITMEVIADQRRPSTLALSFPSLASEADLPRGSYSDLWWQRYVELSVVATGTAGGGGTTTASAIPTSWSGYFHQQLSPSPAAFFGDDLTATPHRARDYAIVAPVSLVRIKNMTNIILQFYFTQPSYMTVTPVDLVSYQRSTDAAGHELFRVLPNETIAIRLVASEEWLWQQQHGQGHGQGQGQGQGQPSHLLPPLPPSSSVFLPRLHPTESLSRTPSLDPSTGGRLSHPNSYPSLPNQPEMTTTTSSPYRSGSTSPLNVPSIVGTAGPSSPVGGSSSQPPAGTTLTSSSSLMMMTMMSPGLPPKAAQSSPSTSSSTHATATAGAPPSLVVPRRDVVTCHCALFDNIFVQMPVLIHVPSSSSVAPPSTSFSVTNTP